MEKVNSRDHPDLRRMLRETQDQYIAEVSEMFAQQVDYGTTSPATRPRSKAEAKGGAKPKPKPSPYAPFPSGQQKLTTEHNLTVLEHSPDGTITVSEEQLGMLQRLQKSGTLTVKVLLPKSWEAILEWEPAPTAEQLRSNHENPLIAALDYIRVKAKGRDGAPIVRSMMLRAMHWGHPEPAFAFSFIRPVTNDPDVNKELLKATVTQAENTLRQFAREREMLNHSDYRIALESLKTAETVLLGRLDVVRRQEQARKNFKMPMTIPDFAASKSGPVSSEVSFWIQCRNYLDTGFKTLDYTNVLDDGFPPTRWEGPTEPTPPTTQKKTKPSKRRRDKMTKETANPFKGVFAEKTGDKDVDMKNADTKNDAAKQQEPPLVQAPVQKTTSYTISVPQRDASYAVASLENSGYKVKILNPDALKEYSEMSMIQMEVTPPIRTQRQPNCKPPLPEPVARALRTTTSEPMRTRFAERLAERFDLNTVDEERKPGEPPPSDCRVEHPPSALVNELFQRANTIFDNETVQAPEPNREEMASPASTMERIQATQPVFYSVGPEERCNAGPCKTILGLSPRVCGGCMGRFCALHYVEYPSDIIFCVGCDHLIQRQLVSRP